MQKTRQFIFQLTAAVFIITALSCKKGSQILTANATVIDSGSVAADGCGWLIKINSINAVYSPINLSPAYQKNNLQISISYNVLTTKFQCGLDPAGRYTQIKLTDIK